MLGRSGHTFSYFSKNPKKTRVFTKIRDPMSSKVQKGKKQRNNEIPVLQINTKAKKVSVKA
ncbi:hypothetical protein DS745_16115 [Anaerobacillus alkaliphilus]|uniref:Uncharacterized protein n=1 Tax=Anaerobacillus alkaliphilus TaxID=1548597 RepID=A0A4Q0VNI7_9BACI|nr:hypothetical protein DS745_16115 [Anaerobacillus alkaliphilus]